jgi:putative endonuclease
MAKGKSAVGLYGEQLACAYLLKSNYAILTTNWRCSIGEIDIVAQEKEMIVFSEVKTRRAETTEWAFANVNPRKREKLVKLAYAYLHNHQLDNSLWRIDVIAVALPFNAAPIIEHVQNALDW